MAEVVVVLCPNGYNIVQRTDLVPGKVDERRYLLSFPAKCRYGAILTNQAERIGTGFIGFRRYHVFWPNILAARRPLTSSIKLKWNTYLSNIRSSNGMMFTWENGIITH